MTEVQLYKTCDEVLGPVLAARGFSREQPARYSRRVDSGEERISISKGPSTKAKSHFSVWITYHPDYMRPVVELFGISKWDTGSLTPPYLTPVGATFRPKYWSQVDETVLRRSLQHVIDCLEKAGFQWLKALHDPGFYASHADPVAALPYAIANEAAGRLDRARAGYQSMLGRLKKILAMFDEKMVRESEVLERDAKPFIFVAAKLGVESERARYFREKLNYHPDIKPLPPE